jgi:uncharacterized membrane protein
MISEQKRAQLQSIVDHGYSFPFSDYISKAFDIFQRQMGMFIGFILMYLITSAVIGSIPLLGDIAVQVLIDPIFTIGMFIVSHKIARKEVPGFEDFFKGTERLGDLILTAVISIAITAAAILPFIFFVWQYGVVDWFWAFQENPEAVFDLPMFPSWTFIFLLPVIYISVAYSWGYQFVYFYDMQAWEGLEWSRQIITKKWFTFFGFSFLLGLIAVSGILLLVVGLLFTIPPVIIAQYVAFADVTKLDEEIEEDISDHLIV